MSRFINFPASCYMTDFEIVELQNDMIRARRLEEIELAERTRRLEQDDKEIEDINIIARVTSKLVQNIDRFPLISPIHSTPTPTRISPIDQNNQDREFEELSEAVNTNYTDEEDIHEESDESSEEEEDVFEESNELEGNSRDTNTEDDRQDDYNKDKGEEKEKNTTDPNSRVKTNDDTSNSGDSFHSPLSTISPKSSNNDKEQTIEEEGEATPKQNPDVMWCARRVVQHKQNMLTQCHLTSITITLAQQ